MTFNLLTTVRYGVFWPRWTFALLFIVVSASGCTTTSEQDGTAPADASLIQDTQETGQDAVSDGGVADVGKTDVTDNDLGATDADASPDVQSSPDVVSVGDDATVADVSSSDKACTFNADCPAAERCECSVAKGCFCKIGARGTGKSGLDICKDGNDCETALCVEGPGGAYYCSGPCKSAADCAGKLPLCSNIAFVGQICIRDPKDT